MLDNGYVYLAATRLSLHFSPLDWALVIEVFGYSPRAGAPDVHVHTFASHLHDRDGRERYVSDEAYRNYLQLNPHNESRFFWPCDGAFQDPECDELVDVSALELSVRGQPVPLPHPSSYSAVGVSLECPPRVQVFELCRYLSATRRDQVLASEAERRVSVLPDMREILVLDEWRHPDLLNNERPSTSPTFQSLARALALGDPSLYVPSPDPNTHWRHWPDGGSL
jgi:hypothetical protein